MSGIVQFGNVTNSIVRKLQSGGVAYSLDVPFLPDVVNWYRYTGFGTDTKVIQGTWFRGMPDGDALNITRGTTDLSSALETTNGVTLVATGGTFTNQHLVITGITTAVPGVVTTSTNHGLQDNDRVVLTQIVGSVATELNNNSYVVQVLSANTFALYDVFGAPIATLGSYTSGGQVTKMGPMLNVQQTPVTYSLTLGTSIMGTDNDVIYLVVSSANNYTDLGDVA